MATLRDIKRRIDSVKNTQQITKAMRMISAAKLNRAQVKARAAQPYAAKLKEMVSLIAQGLGPEDHSFFKTQEEGKTLVLLFTSDKGLCGGFNNNLSRTLFKELKDEARFPQPEMICFGRTGNEFFKRRGFQMGESHVQLREPERKVKLIEVIKRVIERFESGEVGRVFLAYNHFNNPISQEPEITQLLPVEPPEQSEDTRETLFEPSRGEILNRLMPQYVENMAILSHLNTEAGEHGARMVAMEGATKNAGEMISKLTLQYNRLRQAAITKELIEIVNGAQAL